MAHGNIKKLKSGKYRVCFDFGYDANKKRIRKYKTFLKWKDASKALSEHNHNLEFGEIVLPNTMTVLSWLKYWMEKITIPKCKETTIYAYNNIINNHIAPQLGMVILQNLTPRHCQVYLSWIVEEKGLSSNTAIKHYDLLKHALADAKKQEIIYRNPLDRVDRPKKIHKEAKFYTTEQLAKLLRITKGHRLELIVALAAYFGLRREEICGLEWGGIDFEKNIIYISKIRTSAGSKIVEEDDPKTKASRRKLVMPQTIRELLQREYEYQQKRREELREIYIESDKVVVMDGGKPYRPNYVSELFTKHIRENNLPQIVLHELRHTFASISNEAGIPEFNISKAMGHSNPSVTKKIYTHLFDPVHTNAINSVAAIVDNAVIQKTSNTKNVMAILQKAILSWRPVPLLADEEEFPKEIKIIYDSLSNGQEHDHLGQTIHKTFKESFGNRFFNKSLKECNEVADKILEGIM